MVGGDDQQPLALPGQRPPPPPRGGLGDGPGPPGTPPDEPRYFDRFAPTHHRHGRPAPPGRRGVSPLTEGVGGSLDGRLGVGHEGRGVDVGPSGGGLG